MVEIDESASRGVALMALMAAAGEEGRATAVAYLEADIDRYSNPSPAIAAVLEKHGTDFGWRIAECRRAIDIITARTTIFEQVTPSGE